MATTKQHSSLFDRMFRRNVAIDLGTANTLIYSDGDIVLNEPSVVCFRTAGPSGKKRIEAVGRAARKVLGRAPLNMEAVRPVQHGVIADFPAAEHMIRQFFDMSRARPRIGRRLDFTICAPAGATQVELRAIREAALVAGASSVTLIGETLASALGAGLPVASATGSMVVDIGGGTTEVGIISLGGVVCGGAVRMGGDQFDAAIVNYVRSQFGVQIGEHTAEELKKSIGTALRDVPHECMNATGRSAADGMPRTIELSNHDIADAIEVPLQAVIRTIRTVLDGAPPELMIDILDTGIVLTGGGALLRNLDARLREEIGLAVRVAEEPLTCAVRGAGQASRAGWLDLAAA